MPEQQSKGLILSNVARAVGSGLASNGEADAATFESTDPTNCSPPGQGLINSAMQQASNPAGPDADNSISKANDTDNKTDGASSAPPLVDPGPPQVVAINGSPSMAYTDGKGLSIGSRTLPDGRKVNVYADGFRLSENGQSQFVPANMSGIGPTLTQEEYADLSKRASKLTWDYDEPGAWHDFKACVDRFFGITPKPVLTSDQLAEVNALRNIVWTRVDARQNPEKYNPTIAMIDAAAGGPFGALAVGLARDADPETRQNMLALGTGADGASLALGTAAAARGSITATPTNSASDAQNSANIETSKFEFTPEGDYTTVKFPNNGGVLAKLPGRTNPNVVRWQRPSANAPSRGAYVGRTPEMDSPVGLLVQQRMRQAGNLVGEGADRMVRDANGNWHPIDQTEMGHILAAVDYWNAVGRYHGPLAPEVRAFMNDPDNYVLEPKGPNRSNGASSGTIYLPPATAAEKAQLANQ